MLTQRNIDAVWDLIGWSLKNHSMMQSIAGNIAGDLLKVFEACSKEDLHLCPYQIQIKQNFMVVDI